MFEVSVEKFYTKMLDTSRWLPCSKILRAIQNNLNVKNICSSWCVRSQCWRLMNRCYTYLVQWHREPFTIICMWIIYVLISDVSPYNDSTTVLIMSTLQYEFHIPYLGSIVVSDSVCPLNTKNVTVIGFAYIIAYNMFCFAVERSSMLIVIVVGCGPDEDPLR